MEALVASAMKGVLQVPAATVETGACEIDMQEARERMVELIDEIAPGMHVEVSALEKKAELKKIK